MSTKPTFEFVIQILQNNAEHLHYSQNQRAKRQRACVVPGRDTIHSITKLLVCVLKPFCLEYIWKVFRPFTFSKFYYITA